MMEKLKGQIYEIFEELSETKKMSHKRVNELIELTKEIARELGNEKGLKSLEGRVLAIYDRSDTQHPKKRLNKVIGLLMRKVNEGSNSKE